MTRQLTVESLAIGDELLDGRLADTNSKVLADALSSLGLGLVRAVVIDDDEERIAEAVREAAARADVVVTSGGLGPTSDDLTALGVARAAGCSLRLDEGVWAQIQARFAERGLPLPPNNRRQAELPEAATTLRNGAGVAPGFVTRVGSAEVFSFPGVPKEYRWLLEHALVPRLKARLETHDSVALGEYRAIRTLRCLGITESALGQALVPLEATHSGLRVQYRTHFPENYARLVVTGTERAAVEAEADALAAQARRLIGGAVYGVGEASLEERLLAALTARGATLVTAESCTGGLLGKRLTDVPGSSAAYAGGVVAYANEAKTALLEVDEELLREHGAVSEEVARAMAEGARARLGATFALSTTGVAGPGGGSAEKPVGTVCFGLAGPHGTLTKRRLLPAAGRDAIRELAAAVSLRWLLAHLEREGGGPQGPLAA